MCVFVIFTVGRDHSTRSVRAHLDDRLARCSRLAMTLPSLLVLQVLGGGAHFALILVDLVVLRS